MRRDVAKGGGLRAPLDTAGTHAAASSVRQLAGHFRP